jgi:hypothetical protein
VPDSIPAASGVAVPVSSSAPPAVSAAPAAVAWTLPGQLLQAVPHEQRADHGAQQRDTESHTWGLATNREAHTPS